MTPSNVYDENEARRDPAVRLRPALQLAIEDVRPVLTARFPDWRAIPGLQDHSEWFKSRMQAVESGKKTRVDFKRAFARFITRRFPDYPVVTDTGQLFRCIQLLDDKLALGIDWMHIVPPGLGKMIEVKVGARWDDKNAVLYHPLAHFLGCSEAVDWAYSTNEELDACFEGAGLILAVLLPLLAEALTKRMNDHTDLGGAGPVSAREGYDIASPLAANGMELQNITLLEGTGRRWGILVSEEGRLRAHAIWSYHFKNTTGQGARIEVPSLGGPVANHHAKWGLRGDLIGEPWIDSVDAVAALSAAGGLPQGAVMSQLTLADAQPFLVGPFWRIDFWAGGKKGVVFVGARDGHVVRV